MVCPGYGEIYLCIVCTFGYLFPFPPRAIVVCYCYPNHELHGSCTSYFLTCHVAVNLPSTSLGFLGANERLSAQQPNNPFQAGNTQQSTTTNLGMSMPGPLTSNAPALSFGGAQFNFSSAPQGPTVLSANNSMNTAVGTNQPQSNAPSFLFGQAQTPATSSGGSSNLGYNFSMQSGTNFNFSQTTNSTVPLFSGGTASAPADISKRIIKKARRKRT